MKDGYGAPYVKLQVPLNFGDGEDDRLDIDANITDFIYKYSEEGDDTAQIRIETGDPNIADRQEFQEGIVLILIWGYINEEKAAERKVKISNIKINYSNQQIILDILATDLASKIKTQTSKRINSGNINQLAYQIAKDNGLGYDGVEDGDGVNTLTGLLETGYATPQQLTRDGIYKVAVDNARIRQTFNFRNYPELPQANKSPYATLREATDGDPSGPYDIVGRDDKLKVVKRNLNQTPIAEYTYGETEGRLISFTPETKDLSRKREASNINVTVVDPEKKVAYNANINDATSSHAKLGSIINEPPVTNENKGQKPSNTVNASDPVPQSEVQSSDVPLNEQLGLHNDGTPKVFEPWYHWSDRFGDPIIQSEEYGKLVFTLFDPASPPSLQDGQRKVSIDETRVVVLLPIIGTSVTIGKDIPTSEHTIEEAVGKAVNAQANAALERNPGELQVVGDHILESGKVVKVSRVSNKYSGNYYIMECEHHISVSSGYLVTMQLTRNALGSSQGDPKGKVTVRELDSKSIVKKTTPVNNLDLNLEGKSLAEQLLIIDAAQQTDN